LDELADKSSVRASSRFSASNLGPDVCLKSRNRFDTLSINYQHLLGKIMASKNPRSTNSGAAAKAAGAASARTTKSTPATKAGRTNTQDGADLTPEGIVSSSHLVSPRSVEMSELEFAMTVSWNAFSRWIVRCMAAAGWPDLTATDVLLLHHVNHRARNKKLADICFVLNFEDTHVVAYSLKKMVAAGLLRTEKVGKEVFYSPTPDGEQAVLRYREVRERCLIDALDTDRNRDIGELARLLRSLSGLYDQAARSATSL